MIVFVTKNIDTFNNPTIDAILTLLEERKQNSILICSHNVFNNRFKCLRIIFYNKKKIDFFSLFKISIVKILKNIYVNYKIIFIKFNIKTIIAIDPEGLIFASELKRQFFINAPVDYLSFEIFEKHLYHKKDKEIEASKHIRNLIVQDALREEFIRTENKLSNKIKSIYIPVTPIFKVDYRNKIDDFRLVHSISKEKKLIINFGSFDSWSGADFIYDFLEKDCLPIDYVFVIHSRFPLNPKVSIHQKIIDYSLKNKNLILSNVYINSFDDSLLFLKQFDFGTAFYFPDDGLYTGKNIFNIGLASGKFSMYMKAGLPTFTSNLPTYKKLNEKYNFGFVIENIDEFKDGLMRNINKNEYELNCFLLYDELLNTRKIIEDYLNKI